VQGVPRTPENGEDVLYNVVGTQHLRTFGIPLLAGRNFGDQDTAKSPLVAIVNETLARRFFPSGSALGHRFCLCDVDPGHGQGLPFDIEIVGVVRDAKYIGLSEGQHMAAYFPYTQHIQYFGNFSVRSTGSREVLIPAVRHAIAQVNPNIAVAQVVPLADQVRGSIATQRLIGLLCAFFAVLAVFLDVIGIYGLVSYSVVRRTNELGICLALGAQHHAVLWLIFSESLLLLAVGLVVGLPIVVGIALSLAAFLRSQLFLVGALDPFAFLAAVAIISVMTLLAAWLPARRATKVNPMTALRSD
jgi:predicted permease